MLLHHQLFYKVHGRHPAPRQSLQQPQKPHRNFVGQPKFRQSVATLLVPYFSTTYHHQQFYKHHFHSPAHAGGCFHPYLPKGHYYYLDPSPSNQWSKHHNYQISVQMLFHYWWFSKYAPKLQLRNMC